MYFEIDIEKLNEIHMDDRGVQMDFTNGTTINFYGRVKAGPWLVEKLTEAAREYEEDVADEQK